MTEPSKPGRAWLARGPFRVLRHRNVRLCFSGYLPSNLGTAMASLALVFAVLDSGGSAADLGYVLAAGIVPQVALMIGGGVVPDRIGRRQVMLGADLLRTASEALLAALLFAGHPPIWVFAVLAGAVGVGDAFFTPRSTASSSTSPPPTSEATPTRFSAWPARPRPSPAPPSPGCSSRWPTRRACWPSMPPPTP